MSDFATLSADTYPGSLATNKWGDHYYGLPLDTNTRVLITNPKTLSQAGISRHVGGMPGPHAGMPALPSRGARTYLL